MPPVYPFSWMRTKINSHLLQWSSRTHVRICSLNASSFEGRRGRALGMTAPGLRRYLRTVVREMFKLCAIDWIDFPCAAKSCIVFTVGLLSMAGSCRYSLTKFPTAYSHLGGRSIPHRLKYTPSLTRPEHDGTIRVLYAARIADCRRCPLRICCQGHGTSTKKPRRVSAVFSPLPPMVPEELPLSRLCASHAVLWGDWSRTQPRRAWIQWQRSHQVTVKVASILPSSSSSFPFSRAERAHWRLTRQQRFARNARPPTAPSVEITISGLSAVFAQSLGLRVA
jgi:hypothetical protein